MLSVGFGTLPSCGHLGRKTNLSTYLLRPPAAPVTSSPPHVSATTGVKLITTNEFRLDIALMRRTRRADSSAEGPLTMTSYDNISTATDRTAERPTAGTHGSVALTDSTASVQSLSIGSDVITPRLRRADSMWARMRGLLGTSSLAPDEGLWITPCNSIHMFFMRYAIDAIFVDEQLQVVRVHAHVKPWKMARGGKHAHSVLELPAGTSTFHRIRVGDRLTVGSAPEQLRASA